VSSGQEAKWPPSLTAHHVERAGKTMVAWYYATRLAMVADDWRRELAAWGGALGKDGVAVRGTEDGRLRQHSWVLAERVPVRTVVPLGRWMETVLWEKVAVQLWLQRMPTEMREPEASVGEM
jgi:hypothetical protein